MTAPPEVPLISVVIPNYNGASCLEDCLRSLRRQTYPRLEIIVADNNSRDDSAAIVRRIAPDAILLALPENLGFAGGVNAGIRASHGSWVAVLNNDAVAADNWLTACMAAAGRHPEAAFLACRILEFGNRARLYSAGDCFLRAGIGYRRGQELPDCDDYRTECEVFSACGCAALFRREVLAEENPFDPRFFAYLEDVDLGIRLKAAGRRGIYVPAAEVYHHGGMTSGGEFSPLATRLRTRNSLLLLIKCLPVKILWRSLPMIFTAQAVWLARVVSRGRFWSYLRGLAGVIPLIPAMMEGRRKLRESWRENPERLWQAILQSENQARSDFSPAPPIPTSRYLKWYFRVFGPPGARGGAGPAVEQPDNKSES